MPVWPASEAPADRDAARGYDTLVNELFAGPVLRGEYPEGFADVMPGPVAEDLKVIVHAAGLVRRQLLPAEPGRRAAAGRRPPR